MLIDSAFYNVLSDGRIEFQVSCAECAFPYTFVVLEDRFQAWQDGELVQDAFPNMPGEWREMLISSVCPSCFDDLFSDKG